MGPRNKRRRWVWFLLYAAILAAAGWYRCHHGGTTGDSDTAPRPVDATTTSPPLPPADGAPAPPQATSTAPVPAPVLDAGSAEVPYYGPEMWLVRLSSDGQHALLENTVRNGFDAPRFRAVTVDTGALDADVTLESFVVPGIDDPPKPDDPSARLADLAGVRQLLRPFPLGAADAFATSPDGSRGAFNLGDPLHLVAGDKLGAEIKLPAAYDPMVTADGETLLLRGYDGEVDGPGTGKYSLFATPIAGGKLTKIAGTDGLSGRWALSSPSTLRLEVSQLPQIPTCIVEVSLARPIHVTQRRCVEHADHAIFSPSGDHVAWFLPLADAIDATIGEPRKARQRIRTMTLATGTLDLDVVADGFAAISDTGRLLVQRDGVAYDDKAGDVRTLSLPDDFVLRGAFRGDHEFVYARNGTVAVLDLDKMR